MESHLCKNASWILPAAKSLCLTRVLNSLAVRMAVVHGEEGNLMAEFHQRKGGANATYKLAWDVGAAGYIDALSHRDPDDPLRISPWQTSVEEIDTELNIPTYDLPHRDHYLFFGMGRNDPTGQLDLLGLCQLTKPPDPERSLKPTVQAYDRCPLDPQSVSSFVL